jgi:hypothetical protein
MGGAVSDIYSDNEFEEFFEDIPMGSFQHESSYHETIKSLNSYKETGLREDEVHKLMEDISNPLPPVDLDD